MVGNGTRFNCDLSVVGTEPYLIEIGNNCFIGYRAIIMPSAIIGNNCIIGVGSIVTKNIPDNCAAAGVPAKVISTLEEYHEKCRTSLKPIVGMSRKEKISYYTKELGL